jgi:hypothetical protein
MGYRSDVTVAFYIRHDTPFAALKLWVDENYPVREALDEWEVDIETDDKTYINFWYQDVKWYDGYTHPEAVREALVRFDETFNVDSGDGPVAYEMVQVGEEDADISHTGSRAHDYRLGVHREIRFG